MPPEFAPKFKKSNAKEIQFDHNDAKYRLYTAGSPEAGRGTTPTIAHLSRGCLLGHTTKRSLQVYSRAFPRLKVLKLYLRVPQTVLQESFTGYGKVRLMGRMNTSPSLSRGFLTPEYRRPAPEDMELTVEEEDLMSEYDLDKDQMYWRRLKIGEGGQRKFQQEYPANG